MSGSLQNRFGFDFVNEIRINTKNVSNMKIMNTIKLEMDILYTLS